MPTTLTGADRRACLPPCLPPCRYTKSSVSESLTVESRHAGACLMGKMKRFISPKCHALMLDEGELGVNSRITVLLNV